MELQKSIESRISIRAFKPDPVSSEILLKILELSTRSPSSVNSQPWEFYVVRGSSLERLRTAGLEEYRRGVEPHPELPGSGIKGIAPVLRGVYKDRQVALAKQIFQVLGIGKEDRAAIKNWNEYMVRFYDAPAVIIIVVDKLLQGAWPVMDIGLVSANIVLYAQDFGLGTCIMRAIVDYPEKIREIIGIPEQKRIYIGLALGYPDPENPVNQVRTDREPIENIVTWVD